MSTRQVSTTSEWNARQWKVALTRIQNDLRSIIHEIGSDLSISTRGLKAYLGIRYSDTKPGAEQIHLQSEILAKLTDVLDSTWRYSDKIFASQSECFTHVNSTVQPNTDKVHVWIYRKADLYHFNASAQYSRRSIFITADGFTNTKRSRPLSFHVPGLHVGHSLDDLYRNLASTVLHECIHLASSSIKDICFLRSELPSWADKSVLERCDDSIWVRCYTERNLRMLPRLVTEEFASARYIFNQGQTKDLTKPMHNSESILRALLSGWFEKQRPLLEFIPVDDVEAIIIYRRDYKPTIRVVSRRFKILWTQFWLQLLVSCFIYILRRRLYYPLNFGLLVVGVFVICRGHSNKSM